MVNARICQNLILGTTVRQALFLILFTNLFFTNNVKATTIINIPTNIGADAIYGSDDRDFVTKKSSLKIRKLSKSIALIVSSDYLDINPLSTSIRMPRIQIKASKPPVVTSNVQIQASNLLEARDMCVDERFVTSPALSACTGFLVAPNIMASAGHCFQSEDDCANKKIIFDVDSSKQNAGGYSVSSSNVFSCSRIISSAYDQSDPYYQDYSLIELDRVPKQRPPLKLNLSKKISDKEKVFMIGHPIGMPLTLSPEASVSMNSNEFQFSTNLDSFEGNSGSPVFNAKTFQVEGILVNGQEDLVQDSKLKCYRNAVYTGSGNEGVFRSSELAPFLK